MAGQSLARLRLGPPSAAGVLPHVALRPALALPHSRNGVSALPPSPLLPVRVVTAVYVTRAARPHVDAACPRGLLPAVVPRPRTGVDMVGGGVLAGVALRPDDGDGALVSIGIGAHLLEDGVPLGAKVAEVGRGIVTRAGRWTPFVGRARRWM